MLVSKGFTLIELMIVVAIIGILAAVIIPVVTGKKPLSNTVEVCYGGYTFVENRYNQGGRTQIIDANGKGIPCSIAQ